MSEPVQPSAFDRLLAPLRSIIRAELPQYTYFGIYEYAVQSTSGSTVNCDPVDTTIPLPSLASVELRPSILGEVVTTPIVPGSRCLVAFVNSDPTRPVVMSILGTPASTNITAGSQVATEHVATIEGTVLFVYNVLVALMTAAGGGPLTAAILQPLLAAAINTALAAQAVPAPPGQAAQVAAAATQSGSFASGTVPATTSSFFNSAIAAVATKTPNVSGLFPSLGSANVKTG